MYPTIYVQFRVWWSVHKKEICVPFFFIALPIIFYAWQPLAFERPVFPHIDKLLHFVVALGGGALLIRIGTTTRFMEDSSRREKVLLIIFLLFFLSMVWEAAERAYGVKPNNVESSLDVMASMLGAYGGTLWGNHVKGKKKCKTTPSA